MCRGDKPPWDGLPGHPGERQRHFNAENAENAEGTARGERQTIFLSDPATARVRESARAPASAGADKMNPFSALSALSALNKAAGAHV